MDDLIAASATELARHIRAHDVSAQEVVQAYLDRIADVNSKVKALVQIMAEQALDAARAADTALARGETLGPLHGVPFTVKDVVEVAGVISAAGLPERADFRPAEDAVVVTRLCAAGAILLGKTNCPPGGAGGFTDNAVYGRTSNPYQLTHAPGGSSGGEAAAVASGMSPLGVGSDSGGSIRLPAHFCGVAGLRPTTGRIPNTGVFNHPGGLSDPRTQIGPLARSVEDLYYALDILRGVDDHDSSVIPMPLGALDNVSLTGMRVAFYTDDGQATPTQETQEAVLSSARVCEGQGLRVVERRPAAIQDARAITERYWGMAGLSGEQIMHLFEEWDSFRTQMLLFMRDYDIILCPVDYRPAGPHPAHGFSRGSEQKVGQTAEQIDKQIDVSALHDDAEPLRFNYCLPFSLCGYPCVVVRAGTSADGLPIGVQVVARQWREEQALAVARLIERTLGGWQATPL
jgi:amidase